MPRRSRRGRRSTPRRSAQTCHAIAGKGNKQNPLDGVGAKLSADDIRKWIVDPDRDDGTRRSSTKKPPMPKKWASLPAADLDALVAYMQSLK